MAASSRIRSAISSSRWRSLSLGSWQGVGADIADRPPAADVERADGPTGGRVAAAGTRSCTRSQLSSKASASELQRRGLDPGGEQQQEGAFECGIGQKLVVERRPAGLEGHRGADLVEHLDPGRKPGLDRVLGKQALGEGECSVPMAAPSSCSRA